MAQAELEFDANWDCGEPPDGTITVDPEGDDGEQAAADLEAELERIRIGSDGGPLCD